MGSLIKSHEESNGVVFSKYSKMIKTLFRLVEVLFFLIMILKFSTNYYYQFGNHFSLKPFAEFFRGILSTLISPRFVFVLGNAIVIALFLLSTGKFSPAKNGGEKTKIPDFYDQYVEKSCENNLSNQLQENQGFSVCNNDSDERNIIKMVMCRSYSHENVLLDKARDEHVPRRRKLRRSMTEVAKDDMSGDEFRQTVEAFIARRQRFLKEEEEFSSSSPVVSFET